MDKSVKSTSKLNITRMILWLFLLLTWLFGIGCLALGLWMLIDKKVYHPLVIFKRSPSDKNLAAAPAVLLVAGLIICCMGVIGFLGYLKNSRKLLIIYGVILFIAMLFELVVGFLAVHFEDELHRYAMNGMKVNLRDFYEYDNGFGKAWNWVQVRYKCCGADYAHDYKSSKWYANINKGIMEASKKTQVPISCCKLKLNEDERMADTQNPNIVNFQRCQDEALGNQNGGANLNNYGCFSQLLNRIKRLINALIIIGITIGIIQLIGLICTYFIIKRLHNAKEA